MGRSTEAAAWGEGVGWEGSDLGPALPRSKPRPVAQAPLKGAQVWGPRSSRTTS